MAKVRLTIDGKEVEFEKGATILEAAESMGISIPTLCHDPRLKPAGVCRMCVVEVEGAKALQTACTTPIGEGMVVRTNTPGVSEARKVILELILSDHNAECLTCEKNGDCKLQDYVYDFQITKSPYEGEKRQYEIDARAPFIERDLNKCILCRRCIRACDEVQGAHAVNVSFRGMRTLVGTAYDVPLDESTCVFCGQCIAVCPVGALTAKWSRFKGRAYQVEKVPTTCPYCGVGCNIDLRVRDGKVVGVSSEPDSPVNKGFLCVKGRFGHEFIHAPDRLTRPLIKKNGKFEEATWDEAISLVASRFKEIKEKHGNEALAALASAKGTNEENYLMQKLVRAVFGNNNVDHCARLCHASTVAGLAMAFGSGAMTNTIGEVQNAGCIFVIGSNTTEGHPIMGVGIKRAVRMNGAKLIVADPRKTELAQKADVWLRHKPGTDVALVNGMMNVIIAEGLANHKFIEERTENFGAMRDLVAGYTPEFVEGITGVPADDIRKAARTYAQSETSSIVYSMGLTQHTTGTDNVLTMANLAMLTGNLGKESAGVNPLRGQNNVQGACDVGALPNLFPAYQAVANDELRAKFEQAWQVKLSGKVGLTVTEIINACGTGQVKGLYIFGENPMISDPDINHVRHSLEEAEFLVVQDIFLTETAELADVVLPGACFAEKDGTFTSTERRVQRVRKAVEPPGEARPDWKVFCDVATAMGYPMSYSGPCEVMEEIRKLAPSYGGMSYERLEAGGLHWPCPTLEHPGTRVLHVGKFTRGLGKFSAVEYKPPAEVPDEAYPFILTTGRSLYHFHTGTMTRRVEGLNRLRPTGWIEVNPADAQKLGMAGGDTARVTSRRGELTVPVKVTDWVAPGVVFMPFHFKETAANLLTNPAVDPVAKIPELKVCAVNVAKA